MSSGGEQMIGKSLIIAVLTGVAIFALAGIFRNHMLSGDTESFSEWAEYYDLNPGETAFAEQCVRTMIGLNQGFQRELTIERGCTCVADLAGNEDQRFSTPEQFEKLSRVYAVTLRMGKYVTEGQTSADAYSQMIIDNTHEGVTIEELSELGQILLTAKTVCYPPNAGSGAYR